MKAFPIETLQKRKYRAIQHSMLHYLGIFYVEMGLGS